LVAPNKADTHQLGKDPLAPLERLFNIVTRSAAPVPQFFPRMPSLGRQKGNLIESRKSIVPAGRHAPAGQLLPNQISSSTPDLGVAGNGPELQLAIPSPRIRMDKILTGSARQKQNNEPVP
jgi:hypothetical protein